jgi:TRAP-type C4-dicarboxylate transport system permease small subunit
MKRLVQHMRRLIELGVSAILIVLMLLTLVDVVGRYFFGQPLPGGHVLVQCLVCMLVFTGLPIVVLDDEHIRVQFLDQRMTPDFRRWRDFIVMAIIFTSLLVLAGQMFWQARYFADNGEYFESIRIPLSWMALYAAVTSGIAVALAAWRLVSGSGDDE